MQIELLVDHPEFIPLLAEWHHAEWAWLRSGDTIGARIARLHAACSRGAPPTVFIAVEGGKLLGSAMLLPADMDTRPELSPWLGGVFTAPESRGRGIATALSRHVVRQAAALGFPRLYLYTPGAETFYARLGWQKIEHTAYKSADVTVMVNIPPQYQYHLLTLDQLWTVQPLWEKLNARDASLSRYFREEFLAHNFPQRKADFIEKSRTCDFHILLVSTPHDGKFVGYSITSLTPGKLGEIENLFVDEHHRGAGIGTGLMRRTLAWLDEHAATRKTVSVMVGNADAIRFYAQFGFCSRTANLWQARHAPPSAPGAGGGFQYHTAGIDRVDLIEPLWQKLVAHDISLSTHFADQLRTANFQRRKDGLVAKAKSHQFRIELVSLPGARGYIAYALTTLSPEKFGAIESLFIEEIHRGTGIGTALMHRALAWLDKNGAQGISVTTLCENAPAIRFYARLGFHPRTTTLEWKG